MFLYGQNDELVYGKHSYIDIMYFCECNRELSHLTKFCQGSTAHFPVQYPDIVTWLYSIPDDNSQNYWYDPIMSSGRNAYELW
jgi:hypothetical protein